MDPDIITCKEEPFNQSLLQTESNLVRYKRLDVFDNNTAGAPQEINTAGIFRIVSPYPPTNRGNIKYRTNDEGQGVFLTRSQWTADYAPKNNSIITGMDNVDVGYNGEESDNRKIGYGKTAMWIPYLSYRIARNSCLKIAPAGHAKLQLALMAMARPIAWKLFQTIQPVR